MVYIMLAAAGLWAGSFYTKIIYRVPGGLPLFGRSLCPACGQRLAAGEVVPVISRILLKAKCRYCGAKIPRLYMAVEIAAGLLFLGAGILYGATVEGLFYICLWSMLLITAVMDYRHMAVYDGILLLFTLFGALCMLAMGEDIGSHILGGIVCFSFYYLIYFFAKIYYKREAFGMGDVLLITAAGLYLGLWKGLLASIVSFYIALVPAVFKLAGKKNNAQEVPFGPAVCISVFLVSLVGDRIIGWYSGLF